MSNKSITKSRASTLVNDFLERRGLTKDSNTSVGIRKLTPDEIKKRKLKTTTTSDKLLYSSQLHIH